MKKNYRVCGHDIEIDVPECIGIEEGALVIDVGGGRIRLVAMSDLIDVAEVEMKKEDQRVIDEINIREKMLVEDIDPFKAWGISEEMKEEIKKYYEQDPYNNGNLTNDGRVCDISHDDVPIFTERNDR